MIQSDILAVERGRYLLRAGRVLAMDDRLDLPPFCDVLVVDGRIEAVGDLLVSDADAIEIDASDMIVMPGFVEVHWHMWNSIWRGLSHDAQGYFALHRLAGMKQWLVHNGDGRVDLGVVCHDASTIRAEVELARSLNLKTIAPHADLSGVLDLLGPDFIFTHGPRTPPQFMQLLASRGVKIGLCPSTDPLIGAGLPPIYQFMENGVPFADIALSVDVSCQTSVDPFAAMRTVMHASRIAKKAGASFNEIIFAPQDPDDPTNGLMMPQQVLELATINGARVLGLEESTGSLTPGKRADIVMVRTTDLNMLAVADTDASYQVVQNGQPANVDSVMVDGRWVKRGGSMIGIDTREIGNAAARAHKRIRGMASV